MTGTNQILNQAAQNLPPEYVNQLRIFQQILMANHLQSSFLQVGNAPQGRFDGLPKTRFDGLSFEEPVITNSTPCEPLVKGWDRDQSVDFDEKVNSTIIKPKEWSKLKH